MLNPAQLEETFQNFAQNLKVAIPEGIIQVDLKLLHDMGLLKSEFFTSSSENNPYHYFHVIESSEKVTLFNEQFAIWIVPTTTGIEPSTITYIALVNNTPKLEIAFQTYGVYNAPKYILKILQHYLTEVLDNEEVILALQKKKSG